jgi:hypothetical protein
LARTTVLSPPLLLRVFENDPAAYERRRVTPD